MPKNKYWFKISYINNNNKINFLIHKYFILKCRVTKIISQLGAKKNNYINVYVYVIQLNQNFCP